MSSKTRSHKISGLRSPALASSMTLFRYRLLDVGVAGSDPQGDGDLFECDA
jgi:hypothetical protein